MTDREKLIALMRQVDACICNLCVGGEGRFNHSAGILADHLLANGVVVREKGEWQNPSLCTAKCGVCGFAWYDSCQECGVNPYDCNFCPNCGADMRKGENDNA